MQLSFLLGMWEESKTCRKQSRGTKVPPALSLPWALRALGRFDHVGTVDQLEHTMQWMAYALGTQRAVGPSDSILRPTAEAVNVGRYNRTAAAMEIMETFVGQTACDKAEHDSVLFQFAQAAVSGASGAIDRAGTK